MNLLAWCFSINSGLPNKTSNSTENFSDAVVDLHIFTQICVPVLLIIICIVGVLGNGIVILVILRDTHLQGIRNTGGAII